MTSPLRSVVRAASAVMLVPIAAAVMLVVGAVPPADARAVDNGQVLMSPSSVADGFTLVPTGTSACPGDNASNNFLWHTFLIDASVDPSSITFGSTGPILTAPGDAGKLATALRDRNGRRIVNMAPDVSSALISGVPTMNLTGNGTPRLAAGSYRIGIACTLGSPSPEQVRSLWSTIITVNADGTSDGSSIDGRDQTSPVLPSASISDSGESAAGSVAADVGPSAVDDMSALSSVATMTSASSASTVTWLPLIGILAVLVIGGAALGIVRRSRSADRGAS